MLRQIRVAIADDETLARSRIRQLLERDDEVTIVGECVDGGETVQTIEKEHPDLIFLDVQMPELDGIGVVDAVGAERFPAVIFVTAHNHYMEQAFEFHALDYLRKPFTDSRFDNALTHAKRRIQERWASGARDPRLQRFVSHVKGRIDGDGRVRMVGKGGVIRIVPVDEIEAIEAANDHVTVHMRQESFEWRVTLTEAERMLGEGPFLRVHRSHIVNRQRVRSVEPIESRGEFFLKLESGRVVGSGRSFRQTVEAFVYAV